MAYFKRLVDKQLTEWKNSSQHKPLLIRGARQVGKSTAVRELGKTFQYFVEINLEKNASVRQFFTEDIDVKRTCEKISGTLSIPIIPNKTLLFIDEIQVSKEAIMALRYFKEDYPELHVIAAGSLLEFALDELPSFGVGRIRSLYMYPFSFDEFLMAHGLDINVDFKKKASSNEPLPNMAHNQLVELLRTFYIVGGMPAAVTEWVNTHNYIEVARIHNDILDTYLDDFSKYKKRASPVLLQQVLKSVALQAGTKFVYSQVSSDITSATIKDALHLLTLAGLIVPIKHTDGNGIPLGSEENDKYVKYLFFDLGLMQFMLNIPASETITSSAIDFVNKGPASEMFTGLEIRKYQDCFQKPTINYWQNMSRNGNAEIDYLIARDNKVLPIEVKASTQGSMQSLWLFMRKKRLNKATRISLENFGTLEYVDKEDSNSVRRIEIVPLYAISNIITKD